MTSRRKKGEQEEEMDRERCTRSTSRGRAEAAKSARETEPEEEEETAMSAEEESAIGKSTDGEGAEAGRKKRKNTEEESGLDEDEEVCKQAAKKRVSVREIILRKRVERIKEIEQGKKKVEMDKEKENRKKNDGTAQTTATVRQAVQAILGAISRESQGKISFNRADQAVINRSLHDVQDQMIGLIYKQLELERTVWETETISKEWERKYEREVEARRRLHEEVNRIKQDKGKEIATGRVVTGRKKSERVREVEESTEASSEEWMEVQRTRRERTFAEVSKGRIGSARGEKARERESGTRIEGRVVVVGKEGWRTPPQGKQREPALIVSRENEGNARKLAQELAKEVSATRIGGAPKAVIPTQGGRVIIVPKTKEQQEKIRAGLSGVNKVEVRDRKLQEPLLVVSGIQRGMEEKELKEKMARGMNEIEGVNGEMTGEKVRIIRRIPCANPWKENVVVAVGSVNVFKRIVKKGKIELECEFLYAEEYLGVPMCFRCCRYGHMARNCNEKWACDRCGGEHRWSECNTDERRCVNCFRMYGLREKHGARDSECGAMKVMIARARKNTNYDA